MKRSVLVWMALSSSVALGQEPNKSGEVATAPPPEVAAPAPVVSPVPVVVPVVSPRDPMCRPIRLGTVKEVERILETLLDEGYQRIAPVGTTMICGW